MAKIHRRRCQQPETIMRKTPWSNEMKSKLFELTGKTFCLEETWKGLLYSMITRVLYQLWNTLVKVSWCVESCLKLLGQICTRGAWLESHSTKGLFLILPIIPCACTSCSLSQQSVWANSGYWPFFSNGIAIFMRDNHFLLQVFTQRHEILSLSTLCIAQWLFSESDGPRGWVW